MRDIYKKIFKPTSIWGLIGGIIIIIFFYVKKALNIPVFILITANCTITIFLMVACVFSYRKRIGEIGFPIAREMSFLVYALIVSVLLIFRYLDGYFNKFSLPAILLGILLIYGLGRIISYFIGMNMYIFKSKE